MLSTRRIVGMFSMETPLQLVPDPFQFRVQLADLPVFLEKTGALSPTLTVSVAVQSRQFPPAAVHPDRRSLAEAR